MKKAFMDENFLLKSETARALYFDYAQKMPIIDYHCHIDPKQIYEDKVFSDLSEIWLSGDHYKWRALRANGVPENLITGQDAAPYAKFEAWAKTLPRLIGNPLYHWTHLELLRYFGINEPLSEFSAKRIWEQANSLLPSLSARQIIQKSRVEVICTTDDPMDDLIWHQRLAEQEDKGFEVYPTFRPDKALNIDKPGFLDYLRELGDACGFELKCLDTFKAALSNRLNHFARLGCRASDHGLDKVVFEQRELAEPAFIKAQLGEAITPKEADAFKTEMLCFLAQEYRKHNMVMQLHFGAARNVNPVAFHQLGPDSGYDGIRGDEGVGFKLGQLLGEMEKQSGLPKTILYSLNPTDNAQITAIAGCFQKGPDKGKIQHGSAWWFNDTKHGMTEQMTNLANHSVFANFIGMLTDSRSFLSYTRHEYFRRLLCQFIGQMVDEGEYPHDLPFLGQMVQDISYTNAKRYFNM